MSADAEEEGEEWVVSWGRESEGRCQREDKKEKTHFDWKCSNSFRRPNCEVLNGYWSSIKALRGRFGFNRKLRTQNGTAVGIQRVEP